jgi:hypothetical protein
MDSRAKSLCGDPQGEAEHTAQRRHVHRHIDPTKPVAEISNQGPSKSQSQIEHCIGDGSLRRGESNGGGITRQRVEQGNVAEFGDQSPKDDEQDLDPREIANPEHGPLPIVVVHAMRNVPHGKGRANVGDQCAQSENAICPFYSDALDGGIGGQTVHDSASAGTRSGQADSQAALCREPRRQGRGGRHVQEAHAPTKANALAEEKMPDLSGIRGCEQGDELEHCTDKEIRTKAIAMVTLVDDGRYEKCL